VKKTAYFSIAAISLLVGISACRDSQAADAAKQDDFKRDLQLASSTTMDLAAPKVNPSLLTLENQPKGAPIASKVVKKGAGNRAVHSHTPTVRATPDVDVAAVDETSNVTQTVATAPVPEPTSEPVAVAPRPQPVVVQNGGSGGDYGTGSNGGGVLGGGGGIGGVVIRGGGVDGDNCEIHPGRGRYPGRTGGGVYIPIGGGIGGSRMPGTVMLPRTIPTRTMPAPMTPMGSRMVITRRAR
jgi:hypothetical protein